jgi:hypothetical protein
MSGRRGAETTWRTRRGTITLVLAVTVLAAGACGRGASGDSELAVQLVDELRAPGLETELSGIYPHPTRADWYYVVTNGKPVYKAGMKPRLPAELRNKLLLVDLEATIVDTIALPDGGGLFGDLAFDGRHLWLGPLDPPALWKFDLETKEVVARYPLPGPAGGLDYDRATSTIVVQSYVGHPQLVIVDARSGAVVGTRWSDENCQGIKKVGGDWLTVWTSSWDSDAYTELWRLDEESGRPLTRLRLDGIHAAMAPVDRQVAGFEGFMTLVHTGSGETGETVIRRYRYERRGAASAGG